MAAPRKTAAKAPAKQESVVEKLGDICRACWPDGWPHLSHSASCEHGEYSRDPDADTAQTEPPTTTEPPAGGEKQEDPPQE